MLAFRLFGELRAIAKFSGPETAGRYCVHIVGHARTIARQKVLTAADNAMNRRPFKVRIFGTEFQLAGRHFALAREIYGRQPYFASPHFRIRPGDIVVDLGANEGLFAMLAAKLGARVLAIEAQPVLANNTRALLAENFLADRVVVVQGLVGASTGWFSDSDRRFSCLHGTCSIPRLALAELLDTYGIERVDFLKVDIEGSEFDLFAHADGWLNKVEKIAMEVHPSYGNVGDLIRALSCAGFEFRVFDWQLRRAECSALTGKGGYVHAIRRHRKRGLRSPLRWGFPFTA
jgi:FkbM family methyltransferase